MRATSPDLIRGSGQSKTDQTTEVKVQQGDPLASYRGTGSGNPGWPRQATETEEAIEPTGNDVRLIELTALSLPMSASFQGILNPCFFTCLAHVLPYLK